MSSKTQISIYVAADCPAVRKVRLLGQPQLRNASALREASGSTVEVHADEFHFGIESTRGCARL